MDARLKKKLAALPLKDILGYAIHSEDVASHYYWAMAKVFEPNDLVKAKFMALSNDEKLHMKALLGLHKAKFGTERYSVPEGLPPLESVADFKTVESFMEALDTAMENERNARDIYLFLAKANPADRRLFSYLASTEAGHYEILKRDYQFFSGEERPADTKVSKVYASTIFRSMNVGK